jgi:Rieske Fe-S protein
MSDDPDRRGFLKVTTCALGGGLGLVAVAPALRLVIDPSDRTTVTTPSDPIDIGAATAVRDDWRKFDVIAPVVTDAWTTARDVVLGAAWLRNGQGKVEALSAICPHLGCAVAYDRDGKKFLCPCHNSAWDAQGQLTGAGPAKRALDPLPITVVDGRLRLTWLRYKLDTADREQA